jgi:WD40 repeat protein
MRLTLLARCTGRPILAAILVTILITILGEGSAQVWDKAVDSDMPLAVAFSPRGSAVAAAGFGGDVKLWDPRTLEFRLMIPAPNRRSKRALAFSPDGQILAVGGDDQAVRLYDVNTGQPRGTFADHIGMLMSVAFSPDGQTLATSAMQIEYKDRKPTGKNKGEIRLWDVATSRIKQTWEVPDDSFAMSLNYSADGRLLASVEGAVRIRDAATGAVRQSFKSERGRAMAVALSPDGKLVAGGGVGELYVWELETGKLRSKHSDFPGGLFCIDFSSDNQTLAAGGRGPIRSERNITWVSSELRLWNASSGKLIRTIEGPLGGVHAMRFSPDGRMILWCDTQEVDLTETATGLKRATIMKVTPQSLPK